MFCSLMSVFMKFSGFESFASLERWCDFAKFWCGKKKLVAVQVRGQVQGYSDPIMVTLLHPQMHPHTKFEIPTWNNMKYMLRAWLF